MRVVDGVIVYSPSDLTAMADCQFAVLRRLDQKLGWSPPVALEPDLLLERVARLGEAHEAQVLNDLVAAYGAAEDLTASAGVVQIDSPIDHSLAALSEVRDATVAALNGGADVVFQGAFFDGRFAGFADFILKRPDSLGGFEYVVADTKLARSAKVSALLQIAAYADQLSNLGIPVADEGQLILGDGSTTSHDIARIMPVYLEQRRGLETMLDSHQSGGIPVVWGDSEVRACGRCDWCQIEVTAHRDVLLVAGMRLTQRAKLNDVGINTIDELAKHAGSVPGMAARILESTQAQARLQVQQTPPLGSRAAGDRNGEAAPTPESGTAANASSTDPGLVEPVFEVFNPDVLSALPPDSAGDIFFDFEGDPMWRDPVTGLWGLEYLFGITEAPTGGKDQGQFKAFWAHDRAQEKVALKDFLAYVAERRHRWPDMHIYHYAAYEKTALLRLAAQHGVGEGQVDDLLRHHVLVDLYPVVKGSVRVGQPSYSLKKLEPFYMDESRGGEVTNAADSVVEYQEYCAARDRGDQQVAGRKLAEIEDYNRYDCDSTLGLRDWLKSLAPTTSALVDLDDPGGLPDSSATDEADVTAERLLEFADDHGPQGRSKLQTAVGLISASVGYFAREDKPFWWGHFDRLARPVDEWADTRDSIVVDQVEVLEDWHKEGRQRIHRRVLEVTGTMQPGCALERDKQCYLLYENPPIGMSDGPDTYRGHSSGEDVRVVSTNEDGQVTLQVTEKQATGCEPYLDLPMAASPQPGPRTQSIRAALIEVADQTLKELSNHAQDQTAGVNLPGPAANLLLRNPPQLVSGAALPEVIDGDFTTAITDAVQASDGSTIAVQGPPGTGKTYVGARVIAALVNQGWRVGVVSQGHAVVNQLLDGVVAAGVPSDRVGKKGRPESSTWTDLKPANYQGFLAEPGGRVLGGTAWDFTNQRRVSRGQLDLLVIDEAGQYSLAMTLAVSVAAQRLLLLGDPQQLPQVSQGQHPEPVDGSALGWLSEGQTLKPEYGYFLDRTYRMSPALTERVSYHSYESRLQSQESITTTRNMTDADGQPVTTGILVEPVPHHGNAVSAIEEADQIVELTRQALTWSWQDQASEPARPMQQTDILVVAPYNAQVDLIKQILTGAGLAGVRVGTVDKFQGQQAPIVFVSMTASALADVPRGMDFLMSPNRLNVAVSRAKWRATIIHSPALTTYTPTTPDGLADLGGFLHLAGR